jgi:hypothetical protein
VARLGVLLLALSLIYAGPVAAQTQRVKQLIVTDGQGSVLKMPSMTVAQRDASSHNNGESIFCSDCSPAGVYFFFAGTWHESGSGGTGGAPTDATYITQTPNGGLSNEQALSALGTGLMLNTTGTGVLSIYAGASCPANQGITALTASGGPTCASIGGVAPGSALAGVVTITGTATSAPVTFGIAQPDTDYVVAGWTRPLTGTPPRVVSDYLNKQTTGFTVEISAPPGAGNSVEVNWILTRTGATGSLFGGGTPGRPAYWTGATTLGDGTAYRQCTIVIGADNGAAVLSDADIGPQGRQCFAPVAGTVVQVTVAADGGTPSVLPRRNSGGSTTNLLSGALSTAASGGIACAKTTGIVGFDGVTTCAGTLTGTTLAAGDFLELISGTAGGVAKRLTVGITWSEP